MERDRIREGVDSATTTALHVQEFAHNARYFYDQAGHAHHHAHQSIPSYVGRTFLGTIIPLVKQTIYYTICGFVLFSTSVVMYAFLYSLVMPEHYATKPIFFDYNYKSCGSAVCPPTAVIDLISLHTQWKAHVPDVIHHQKQQAYDCQESDSIEEECTSNQHYADRILEPKQSYFIQVALTLPESKKNRGIGMFMIESVLKSKGQRMNISSEANFTKKKDEMQTLATSSRPTMLPYQSAYVSSIKKSFIMIPLILEAVPEARTVVVECFDHFRESITKPMNFVEIRLVIPSHLQNGNEMFENVQVWKAELRIGKELNRIQLVMKEWFYTSACVGTIFFMCLLSIVWMFFKVSMYGVVVFVKRSIKDHNKYSESRNDTHCFESEGGFSDGFSYLDVNNEVDPSSRGTPDSHVSVNASFFDENDSSQWEPTLYSGDADESLGRKRSAVYKTAKDGTQDLPTNNSVSNAGKKKKRKKKKKKKLSSNKSELRPDQAPTQKTAEDERIMADRVMSGDFQRYEVFTGEC